MLPTRRQVARASSGLFRCAAALGSFGLVIVGLAGASALRAQTIAITDLGTTFNPITTGHGSLMQDPMNDQQTGHKSADFVGSSTSVGFQMKLGAFADGVEMMMFRFTFQEYRAQGFQANLRLGIDADGDGAVDLYFGPSTSGNPQGIFFQDPTGGLNVSPSTTSLTKDYGGINLVTTGANANFSYVDTGVAGAAGELTFALPFETLASTLFAQTGIVITPESFVRFVAFTSTQSSSINRDIYGLDGGLSSTVRFDAPGGGFSDYLDGSGNPVPELSSFVYAAGLLVAGIGLHRRRRRPQRRPHGHV